MNTLFLVSGEGHRKSKIEAAESAKYCILGMQDMSEEAGKTILSTKVIGTDDDVPGNIEKVELVITVDFIRNSATRIILYNKVKEAGGTFIGSQSIVNQDKIIKMEGDETIFSLTAVKHDITERGIRADSLVKLIKPL
jgi:hypothetical protein